MILIIIGVLAGIIGGMGIGGGTILIPSLVFFCNIGQKTAQGINLMTFLPVSTVALIIHTSKGRVKYREALFMTAFATAGALLGSNLAIFISSEWLKKLFGAFLLIMGVYEFIRKDR